MVWKLYTLFSLPRCLKEIYPSRIRISSCRFRDNSAVAIQRTTCARSLSKRGVKATSRNDCASWPWNARKLDEVSRSFPSNTVIKRNDSHIAKASHSRDGLSTYALYQLKRALTVSMTAATELYTVHKSRRRNQESVVRRSRLHPGLILNNHRGWYSFDSMDKQITMRLHLRADVLG